jgi:hypothetical protein
LKISKLSLYFKNTIQRPPPESKCYQRAEVGMYGQKFQIPNPKFQTANDLPGDLRPLEFGIWNLGFSPLGTLFNLFLLYIYNKP